MIMIPRYTRGISAAVVVVCERNGRAAAAAVQDFHGRRRVDLDEENWFLIFPMEFPRPNKITGSGGGGRPRDPPRRLRLATPARTQNYRFTVPDSADPAYHIIVLTAIVI